MALMSPLWTEDLNGEKRASEWTCDAYYGYTYLRAHGPNLCWSKPPVQIPPASRSHAHAHAHALIINFIIIKDK